MRRCEKAFGAQAAVGAVRLALIAGVAASLVAASASGAAACSILPPPMPPAILPMPGETDADFAARRTLHFDGFNALQAQDARNRAEARQSDLWTRAERVAVVEVVSIETEVEIPNSPMGRGVRTRVKPVGWIKGSAAHKRRAPFMLAHQGYTSCGPSPNWPVFAGAPGDRFMVFLSAAAPSQNAVLDVIKPDEIVLGPLATALAAQVR